NACLIVDFSIPYKGELSCFFLLVKLRLTFCLFPGEVLVIGSNLPIIAAPGDDVILPCHLEPTFDVQGLTVEWSKPNLKPDLSDEYMASYFRRTELFMDDMKHGNISLKILNVSEEDNGRYRCFIPKLQSRVKAAVVELVVGEKICFGDYINMYYFVYVISWHIILTQQQQQKNLPNAKINLPHARAIT
uniref:Ig-like domain-containing protein n=1 Tax=Maylandia zebra TaxID=106582 RepID=A0A3P9AUL0_9CICH